MEAVAELTETVLLTRPEPRILATSREPLNIAREAVLPVPPLTVPQLDRGPTLAGLRHFDAVTLFTDRAAAVAPGFELDEDNKAAVSGICAHLDGLPLAIELAAARLRTTSPVPILTRLTDRYALNSRLREEGAPTRNRLVSQPTRSRRSAPRRGGVLIGRGGGRGRGRARIDLRRTCRR